MKIIILSFLALSLITINLAAQDTFSIVAADSSTREVGSAGASCVDLFTAGIPDGTFIGDLLPDTGAINTQAYYLATNQSNARVRMRSGDSPVQIIDWLVANDVQSNPAIRQYGIVGFTGIQPSVAGYTGVNCQNFKDHRTGNLNGIYYSIQGNILLGQVVIDSMESKFRNAQGDLACRLMAALQGAKMVGADTRCTSNGTSSLFAYVKVAQPTDSYSNPSFKQSIKTHSNAHIEPIDSLQTIFSAQHYCGAAGIDKTSVQHLVIFPNPAKEKLTVTADHSLFNKSYIITDQLGRPIITGKISVEGQPIDIHLLTPGMYFIQVGDYFWQRFIKN